MESISTKSLSDKELGAELSESNAKAKKIVSLIGEKYAAKSHKFEHVSIEQLAKKSLYIYGATGVGKTALVSEIIKYLVNQNMPVKFINVTEFLHKLQKLFRNNGNPYEFAEDVAEYKYALVVDDLGIDKSTEYVMQIMHYLFNYRNVHCLQTIVTSNLTIAELADKFHERISSRIGEMCEPMYMSGRNRRIKNDGHTN